jgi:hypothetical protein
MVESPSAGDPPPPGPLRLGGRIVLPDGASIAWSVAEGRRGHRWREALTRDGRLERSLLLEVDPEGRPSRLELTTAAGLLTLHPAPDARELHGNVVTTGGVRHLAFTWSPEHELLVLGSPAAATVSLRRLAAGPPVGEGREIAMLQIDDALDPRLVAWQVTRIGRIAWQLRSASGDDVRLLSLDDRGLVAMEDAEVWPLELD